MSDQRVGEWVTVAQAAIDLQKTYWQVHAFICKHSIETKMLGHTRMVRLADLENLRTTTPR